jgi:flagellar basal-body rod protein FlgG
MDPALRTAATGMAAQQTRVEVISNNLANVNTTAFKRSRAHFEDLLYQTIQGEAAAADAGVGSTPAVQIGRGTRLAAVQRVDIQGAIEQTGRPLDLAIEGDGFFQIRRPDGGTVYTRDGSFTISDQGVLVTNGGYAVEPGVGIPVDAREITISSTGIVSISTDVDAVGVEVGRIELVRFPNSAGLRALGENLYAQTAASGEPLNGFAQDTGFGRILQGGLESSNVEIVQEMVDMITAMRAYEINSKAVQSAEEMTQIANGLIR